MTPPSISIVTPVLNDVRVRRALDSILGQRHAPDLELVVVDAGSTDGTLEVLHAYRHRIAALIVEPDEGIYDGMNKGIRRSTGDVIGILNADDRYSDPLVLRDVAQVFQQADVDVCYGNVVYVNDAGRILRYWRPGEFRGYKWRFGWAPPHPTLFVRRRVYERYGAFDLDFPISGDYELSLRLLLKHGVRAAYVDRVLVDMAPGGNATGSVGALAKGHLEMLRAWRCNQLRGGHAAPLLKQLSRGVQYLRRPPPPHAAMTVRRPWRAK